MLTVRHANQHGQIIVLQAARVIHSDPLPHVEGEAKSAGYFECFDDKHELIYEARLGSVYVMNENGKTVSGFNLST